MQAIGLIKRLLSIYNSEEQDFRGSKQLDSFCVEYSIGKRVGAVWRFNQADKEALAVIMRNEAKVDPGTDIDAWNGIPRHEALQQGGNEKYSSKRLRENRVAIKSLPGKPLLIGSSALHLPDGACLDYDFTLLINQCGHDSVLLIENWENFELTHQTPFLETLPGNPLVVFRGAPGSYSAKCSNRLLIELGLPVIAFTDYDPEGLVIAATLPCFSRYLAPSSSCLIKLMEDVSTKERYLKQIAGKIAMLEGLTDPELVRVYRIIRAAGKALPQEKLIGLSAVLA